MSSYLKESTRLEANAESVDVAADIQMLAVLVVGGPGNRGVLECGLRWLKTPNGTGRKHPRGSSTPPDKRCVTL